MSPPTLPEHQSPWNRGKKAAVTAVLLDWFKESWQDYLTIGAVAAAALGIYQAPLAAVRTFAVAFDESGHIVYPELAYPYRGWIIPVWLSAVLSVGVPGVVILLVQIRIRSFRDTNNAIIGLLYSMSLSALFQVIMKMLIGGFRPYFLEICQPDMSQVYAAAHNSSGLSAVGFRQLYFSSEICTTDDKQKLKTAMTSFPSGHSTAAWAGFVYLFLYLNAKLKVFADYRPRAWKVAVLFAPIEGAVLISCSLTIDQAHHWYDAFAGAVIGLAVAFACYRMVYASIWDWKFNHVPLQPREEFLYAEGKEGMSRDHAVWPHRANWGPQDVLTGGEKATGAKAVIMGHAAGAPPLARYGVGHGFGNGAACPNGGGNGGTPRSSTTSGTAFGNGPEGRPSQDEAGLRLPPQAAGADGEHGQHRGGVFQ